MNPWKRLEALLQPDGALVGTVQQSSGGGRSLIETRSGISIWVDGEATAGKVVVVERGAVVRVLETMTFYDIEV